MCLLHMSDEQRRSGARKAPARRGLAQKDRLLRYRSLGYGTAPGALETDLLGHKREPRVV